MLRRKENQIIPYVDPLEKPDYVEADVQAIRAVHEGRATPEQQKRMCDWLIQSYGTYDTSYRPKSERDTIFAEGRRYAGMILVWMIKYAPSKTSLDKIAVRLIGEEHVNADEQAQ